MSNKRQAASDLNTCVQTRPGIMPETMKSVTDHIIDSAAARAPSTTAAVVNATSGMPTAGGLIDVLGSDAIDCPRSDTGHSFGMFSEMFKDPTADGKKYPMQLTRVDFDAYDSKPEGFPTRWLRIAGKNSFNSDRRIHGALADAVPAVAEKLKAVLKHTTEDPFGVIWEGDNYEYDIADFNSEKEEAEKEKMSPFSGLIAHLMKEGVHCMAIKEAKGKQVGKGFYEGWNTQNAKYTAAGDNRLWMMFVDDSITKEKASLIYANLGTFFFGSALPDYQLKEKEIVKDKPSGVKNEPSGVKGYTTGFKQVKVLRSKPEEYDEYFFTDINGLDKEASVLFLKI